ncbi:hypothetical protein HRbin15_00617 [bacterium HR15]|nr:hypothetical protein HRbin15_00617 [bacterium HR15]
MNRAVQRFPLVTPHRLIALLYLVASFGMTLLTSALHFDRDPRSCLEAMLDGSAHRPFVTRRLVPDMIKTLTHWTPQEWQVRVVQRIDPLPDPLPRLLLGRNRQAAFAHLLLVLSVWGCYWGVLWLWREMFQRLLTGQRNRAGPTDKMIRAGVWGLPLLGLALVYPLLNWRHGVHLYDPATLLLYTAALWLFMHGTNWLDGGFALQLTLLAFAAWHKETAVLLIVWWIIAQAQSAREVRWHRVVWMLLVYLGVRLWLGWLYRGNPGTIVEFWLLKENLPFLASIWTGFSGRHVRFLLILSIAIGLPAWGWRRKPLLLRRMMLAGLVVMGIPWLTFGILDEFRALLELYPLWLMLCMPGGYSLPSTTATAPSGMVNRS